MSPPAQETAPDTAWDFSSCLEGLWWSIVLPAGCGPHSAEVDTEEGERSELSFSPTQEQGNIPGTRETFLSCCVEETGCEVGQELLVQQLWALGGKAAPPQLNTVTLIPRGDPS